MRTVALRQERGDDKRQSILILFPQKHSCAYRNHTSWNSGIITEKGWSSDFSPLPSAFSSKYSMAFMLRSHNGVHCCGTVGDSHPCSQLSTAKCTFTGDSLLNHGAKIVFFYESSHVFPIFFRNMRLT